MYSPSHVKRDRFTGSRLFWNVKREFMIKWLFFNVNKAHFCIHAAMAYRCCIELCKDLNCWEETVAAASNEACVSFVIFEQTKCNE